MLRIVTLVGNIGLLITLIIILIINQLSEGALFFIIFSTLVVLSVLNIYFIINIGACRGPFSLYLKRKKLEEEIKIQEAENKLKELQS
ncbi:MAG: hypothetical protein L6305_07460 [Actinomycetia bacterium]|nr:hypothetical protein [Actinomycetes bacterium]